MCLKKSVPINAVRSSGVHIRVGISRRLSELAVFAARLDIRVRRLDEPAKSGNIHGHSRFQFYVAHELAIALKQAGRIGQRCALKESHVHVRGEDIDIAEGRISETCNRAAVMQKLANFVSTFSHYLKPLMRDGS